MPVKPPLVEQGFYYEKQRQRGWLRVVIDFRGAEGRVRYADWQTIGQCTVQHLARWAQRRLTEAEAAAEFPDEVAKIKGLLSP